MLETIPDPIATDGGACLLGIVVPCYNEEEVLSETAQRLTALLDSLIADQRVTASSRVFFVDDGSSDGTWALIEQLARNNPLIAGIKLSRNQGHQNALLAGLFTVDGDVLVSVDADLQDDIEVIRNMLSEFNGGVDVVYGVRKDRSRDSWFKRTSAQGFYRLMSMLGAESVYNHADFRLMSRRAIEALKQFHEVNLFLRGIVPLIGFKSAIVYYDRSERFAGISKYPLRKMLSFAFDAVTSFSVVPLRLITLIGFIVFALSSMMVAWTLWIKLFTNQAVPGWTSTTLPIYFLGGLQILCVGIIGEYLGKLYQEVKARPRYIIEKILPIASMHRECVHSPQKTRSVEVSTSRETIKSITPHRHFINFIYTLWFIIPVYLLLGWVLFLTAPDSAFLDDMEYWHSWARHIHQYGIGQIYTDPNCNYHPIWLMMLGVETWLRGEWFLEGKNILVAKSWPLLFNVLGALGVFLLIKQREGKVWLPLVALLNLAYIYNSWIWFQVDSIYTVFSLLALIFILRGQVAVALLCLTLAINTKLQAIIFFPAFGLLLLPFLFMRPLLVASGLLLALLVQGVILAPFWQAGTLPQLWQVVTNAHHTWPIVSINAYNLWYLFIPEPTHISDDELLVIGLTYKQIGFGLFLIFSTVTLLPLARRCWLWLRTNSIPNLTDAPLVMLSASSVTLVFFFFNTEMHERYSYPAILALFYYGALTRRWWLYGLFSFAYLINIGTALSSIFDGSWSIIRELIEYFKWFFITHTGLSLPKLTAVLFMALLGVSLGELYNRHWHAVTSR